MSDERDETRSFSPFDETAADETRAAGLDDTRAAGLDETRAAGLDETRAAGLDETRAAGDAVDDDATRVAPRPDATSVMPPAADDWAPSRANPVWSGRAEVRPPHPGRASYDTDWQTGSAAPPEQPKDRWWMPIVVGIVVLILLALLGWGAYMIVQNSKNDDVSPGASAPTTVATTVPTSAAPTTPSSEPTTTTPSTEPTTTDPTTTEVLVPALRGLKLDDARDALNQTGLRYRVLYRNTTAPQGTVIDSDPAEGQVVPPDTRVTIVVSGTDPSATPTTAGSTSAGNGGN
jgi:PASTA domain